MGMQSEFDGQYTTDWSTALGRTVGADEELHYPGAAQVHDDPRNDLVCRGPARSRGLSGARLSGCLQLVLATMPSKRYSTAPRRALLL